MSSAATKDFLRLHDLPADIVIDILDRAGALAAAWNERRMPRTLEGKRIALVVDDSGWRNTTAFDLGIQAMGGICVHSPLSLTGRETIADLAGYLDNWFDLVVVRTRELSALDELAAYAAAPVINARTRSNHPCETLGDLAYVRYKRGSIEGLKVVCVAPDANILRSWIEASLSLPIEVVQVYPETSHARDPALLNPKFRASCSMDEIEDADVIITDSWPGDEAGELESFRISAGKLDRCKPDLIFIPCPPVARGQEVTADAMTHSSCQSREAKAFLLHAQNALMEWVALGTSFSVPASGRRRRGR